MEKTKTRNRVATPVSTIPEHTAKPAHAPLVISAGLLVGLLALAYAPAEPASENVLSEAKIDAMVARHNALTSPDHIFRMQYHGGICWQFYKNIGSTGLLLRIGPDPEHLTTYILTSKWKPTSFSISVTKDDIPCAFHAVTNGTSGITELQRYETIVTVGTSLRQRTFGVDPAIMAYALINNLDHILSELQLQCPDTTSGSTAKTSPT